MKLHPPCTDDTDKPAGISSIVQKVTFLNFFISDSNSTSPSPDNTNDPPLCCGPPGRDGRDGMPGRDGRDGEGTWTFQNSWSVLREIETKNRCREIGQVNTNAAVNGQLELTLLKGRQRFDAVPTSNLEVYKFRDWWIFTYFISGHDESSPYNI